MKCFILICALIITSTSIIGQQADASFNSNHFNCKNELGINISPFLPFMYTNQGFYKRNYMTFLHAIKYEKVLDQNYALRFQFEFSPTLYERYSETPNEFYPYGMSNSVLMQHDSSQISIKRYLRNNYLGLSFGCEKRFAIGCIWQSIGIDFSTGLDFIKIESNLDSVVFDTYPSLATFPSERFNIDHESCKFVNCISGIYVIYELTIPIWKRISVTGQIGTGINYIYGKDVIINDDELETLIIDRRDFFFRSRMKNNIYLKYTF